LLHSEASGIFCQLRVEPVGTSGRDLEGVIGALAETARRWHVLHTKSRQEKTLASTLEGLQIRHYLPLIRRASYYGRRKLFVDVPLFPNYLFLWGTLDEAYLADRTKRVARVIQVADQAQLQWELENIRCALASDAPLLPHPFLENGVRVEVRAGPLKGLQGVVERRKRDRLVLQVDAFGQAVSLEIDASLLEALG
jgi:transcription antitermination factor NusG